MTLTRRGMLGGGLLAGMIATPAAASMARWQWRHGHGTVLLYDASLPAGRAFAEAGRAWNRPPLALANAPDADLIRLARQIFAERPALVRGVSRQADAVLVHEVAAEAGYERTALVVDGDALTWTLQPRVRG
ncbi:MAG: hypothetical protein ABIT10_13470 [Alteraurantiacibacter sp.]